jgi:twitching motility two-component system response regulator PilG
MERFLMSQDTSAPVRLLSYRELLLTLQRLCKEKRTGSMFINDGSEHSAKLVLEQGLIFDVTFKGQSGQAALALIKEIKQGKASFSSRFGQTNAEPKINLSTAEIFQILVGAAQSVTAHDNLKPSTLSQVTPEPVKPPQTVSSQPSSKNTTLHIEIPADYQAPEITQTPDFSAVTGMVGIEEQLAAIVGPVARIIYLDYLKDIVIANDVKELNAAVEKIAKQTLSPEQQQFFRQGILNFIRQYNLKAPDAILFALKGSQKKIRLNPTSLALCITKHAGQSELGPILLSKLAVLLEQGGNVGSLVTLLDVLRLLEKSGKTGLLEVREKEKIGGFYFDKGVLINAVQCNMNGKLVAMEMMQWTADYLVFRAVPQAGVSRQINQSVDILAKDAEKFQEETSPKPQKLPMTKADEIVFTTKAIYLAESFDLCVAEPLLCQVLMSHDQNFKAWFWLSRVLTNMTAIEIALKKAAHINPRHPELGEDIKKFTLARKAIKGDFVLRCPFCWMPTDEQEVECPYCKANFFITPDFFKLAGKAKTEELDRAIERYSHVLQEEVNAGQNVYLRFYLAMAYLNRKYYQEALDQFDEITKLAFENKALLMQNQILKDYMSSLGLALATSDSLPHAASINQQKILIVEDSMVTRKVIARTLLANGYEVFEAKNAHEALTDFEKRNPDLVLLDIVLPGKDGYEILAEIRQKPMFVKLPVVMLTSRDSLFDKLKGKVSDANEYLTKPFQPDQLLTIVRKYLSK